MTELLHRPATEFGLYFLLFPDWLFDWQLHFESDRQSCCGRDDGADRLGPGCWSASRRRRLVLWSGLVTPLAFFLPGTFITMAQGIAMPYAQVGAMTEIPRYAGTAAGIGVFMQNFCAALFSQLYGLLADGTPGPMVMMALLCGGLTLAVGTVPFMLRQRAVRSIAGLSECPQRCWVMVSTSASRPFFTSASARSSAGPHVLRLVDRAFAVAAHRARQRARNPAPARTGPCRYGPWPRRCRAACAMRIWCSQSL